MIYVLLIGLILELIYCYYVFEKDLFSPSAILCEVFILSVIACIFNVDKWGVNLGVDTLLTILGGNAVFIFASSFIHRLYKRKHNIKNEKVEGLEKIRIRGFILALTVLSYLVFSIFYIRANVSVLTNLSQSGDVSKAMSMYRYEVVHEDGVSLPVWLTRTNTILGVGIYVLIYIFINNFIVDKKEKSNYLLLGAIVLYLVSSAFTAQRTTILLAFIYALFVAYTLLNRKYQFVKKINTKYIFRGGMVVLVFLILFGITRNFFGRIDDNSTFENITYYMGNSIESLDLYIKKPLENKQFGEELFREFRVNLSKYGLAEETTKKSPHLEFRRDVNNNPAGNVYTAYRYYIHDFGYGSIIFFQVLLAVFYGIWYEKLNHRKLKSSVDLSFVFYAWFCLPLFRFSITNEVFNKLALFLFSYWYIFLLWKIFLSLKISFAYNKNIVMHNKDEKNHDKKHNNKR